MLKEVRFRRDVMEMSERNWLAQQEKEGMRTNSLRVGQRCICYCFMSKR